MAPTVSWVARRTGLQSFTDDDGKAVHFKAGVYAMTLDEERREAAGDTSDLRGPGDEDDEDDEDDGFIHDGDDDEEIGEGHAGAPHGGGAAAFDDESDN